MNYPFLYDGINNWYPDICVRNASITSDVDDQKGLIGVLTDCLSCVVTEEINGAYDLKMTYKSSGIFASQLKVKNIIGVIIPSPDFFGGGTGKSRQYFIISQTKRKMNTIEVYAYHVSYEMTWIPVIGFPEGVDITSPTVFATYFTGNNQYVIANPRSPFTIATDPNSIFDTALKPFVFTGISSLKKYMLSLAETFNGEWAFDNLECRIFRQLGIDNGMRISDKHNMTDYEFSEDYAQSYTGILGFARKSDGTILYGKYDGPASQNLYRYDIQDYTDYVDLDGTDTEIQARLEQLSFLDTAKYKTQCPIITLRTKYLNDTTRPEEIVGLGDFVYVNNSIYDDIWQKTRVLKLEFDVLTERVQSINLAYWGSDAQITKRDNQTNSLSNTIASMQSNQGDMQREIATVTETGGGGGGGDASEYERAYRLLAYGERLTN